MNEQEIWQELKQTRIEKAITLGGYFSNSYHSDIKHICFTLARYKFVSKLLLYKKHLKICELGCNEGLGAELLIQNNSIAHYTGIDFDSESIEWNKRNMKDSCNFINGDFFDDGILEGKYDAVISLDVIEHIDPNREDDFCRLATEHLEPSGCFIVGTPNITMFPYESEGSKATHINMYSQDSLYGLLDRYFDNVFIFNMNDEVINVGFAPMACYFFAVCTGLREDIR